MKKVLHILMSNKQRAEEIIALQKQSNQTEVRVRDFNESSIDYSSVIKEIFEADSVEVW